MSITLLDVYDRLLAHYGPQAWWPGDSRLEIMVGAILTQNTSWRNVEKAILNLKEEGLFDPFKLQETPQEGLAEIIRPAGYYRLKAKRLQNLMRYVVETHHGDLDAMFACSLSALREDLLALNGIGPETADAILLYAGELPTFVVDTYTARVLKRHGWIEQEADYHQIQDLLVSELPQEVPLYNEYHALLVRVGNAHCRKTPKCDTCPLCELLPPGGIEEGF
ncbi:endonuclease III domain-containing protein [Blastopirellula retiformator]|uniref:Ultraviolet N-glycosylase/AP lyase n=1 Tax=Blastopirellula retiformator TaxID=2527970 RepID=A0A5C5VKG6_9BACT|nr:endonuclease III domain-containing protein [Blastopirellula retiformator]TWT39108.1 Ultraviolet N-glycosylase/AP lyase [Blastopirellula retiformator]